jgi:hypothetical protein
MPGLDYMVYLIGRLQQAHNMCVFNLWRRQIKTEQNSAAGCWWSVHQQRHTWFRAPFGIRSEFNLMLPASGVLEIFDLLNIGVWRVKVLLRIKCNTACPQFHVHCESMLYIERKFIQMSSAFAKTSVLLTWYFITFILLSLRLHIPVVLFNYSYILVCIAVGSYTRYDTHRT